MIAAKIDKSLIAPMLFDGTCNTEVFNAWLKQELCPYLNDRHILVMDNATFHKSNQTVKLVQDTGAEILFLPPYSPDLNPIEKAFATIKKNRQNYPNQSIQKIIADSK